MMKAVFRPAWPRSPARRRLRTAEKSFDKLCRRRRYFAIFAVGLLSFLLSELTALKFGVAPPLVHDEFSYLLAADTFAHGRLTNPPHPFWQHFETVHTIQQPTYASMYPPAQGLAIAFGQALTGHPIAGVWISMAVACALLAWMLWVYVPPRWAVIGGCIAVIQFGLVSSWSRSYWGGAVAFAGGALLFGALRRLANDRWLAGRAPHPTSAARAWWLDALPAMRHSLLFALGLLVLANSRPFEGFVASLPALAMLGVTLARRVKFAVQATHVGESRYIDADGRLLTITGGLDGAPGTTLAHHATNLAVAPGSVGGATIDLPSPVPAPWRILVASLAPMLVLLVLGGAWMLYYNHRVTGGAFKMPWRLHHEQYCTFPAFIWGKPSPAPHYNDPVLRDFHTKFEMGFYDSNFEGGVLGLVPATWEKIRRLLTFYLGPVLAIALIGAVALWRNRWLRFAAITVGVLWLANLTTVVVFAHYAAPGAALVMLIVVLGLRRWMLLRLSGPLVVAVVLLAFIPIAATLPTETVLGASRWALYTDGFLSHRLYKRSELVAQKIIPVNSLVIVRYSREHAKDIDMEWVYNDADIDNSPVVWAREMGPAKDKPMIAHFLKQNRTILLWEPDVPHPRGGVFERLTDYPIERLGFRPIYIVPAPPRAAPTTSPGTQPAPKRTPK